MNRQTLGLSITTILLLAACGGSGDNSPETDPGNGKNNAPPPPANNNPAPPTNQVSGRYQGKTYIIPVNGGQTRAQNIGTDTPDTLNINGAQVLTRVPGFYVGGFFRNSNGTINGKSYRFFIISGTKYASRFGYFNEGNNDHVFSIGERTTNMPTSGSANYSGEAVVGRGANAETATAKMAADFGKRTLSGEIAQELSDNSRFTFKPIAINATISGDSFSQTGNISSFGHFYGSNATEVGGIFHDSEQSLYGSFGAKRDN